MTEITSSKATGDSLGRLFQGVEKNSKAFFLMKQMGWEEGTGLGKNRQGIISHVRVKKRMDSEGLGAEEARKAASDWTVRTAVFDDLLKKLNVRVAAREEERKNQAKLSSTSPSSSDDENDKSGDSSDPSDSSDSGYASSSEKEDDKLDSSDSEKDKKIEPTLKLSRPQGRYKRREAGKLVSQYSQTDLSAILGAPLNHHPKPTSGASLPNRKLVSEPENFRTIGAEAVKSSSPPSPPPLSPSPDVPSSPDKSTCLSRDRPKAVKKSSSEPNFGSAKSQGGDSEKSNVTVSLVGSENVSTGSEKKPVLLKASAVADGTQLAPIPADWWGSRFGFRRAGALGSISEPVAVRDGTEERATFSEQDQENLYHLVHEHKNSGKKGLGIGDRPKKVGGVRWEGAKKKFDDEEEEDGVKDRVQMGVHEQGERGREEEVRGEKDVEKKRKRKNEREGERTVKDCGEKKRKGEKRKGEEVCVTAEERDGTREVERIGQCSTASRDGSDPFLETIERAFKSLKWEKVLRKLVKESSDKKILFRTANKALWDRLKHRENKLCKKDLRKALHQKISEHTSFSLDGDWISHSKC